MKHIILVCSILVLFLFGGCEVMDTYTREVEVVITHTEYKSGYVTPVRIGKVNTVMSHPSHHYVHVMYNDTQFVIDDMETYDIYKDSVGKTVTGILEITQYKNGKIKRDIQSLVISD